MGLQDYNHFKLYSKLYQKLCRFGWLSRGLSKFQNNQHQDNHYIVSQQHIMLLQKEIFQIDFLLFEDHSQQAFAIKNLKVKVFENIHYLGICQIKHKDFVCHHLHYLFFLSILTFGQACINQFAIVMYQFFLSCQHQSYTWFEQKTMLQLNKGNVLVYLNNPNLKLIYFNIHIMKSLHLSNKQLECHIM